MKKIMSILLEVVMIFSLAACGSSNNNASESAEKSDSEFIGKAVVVYYSGSGNTKRVAELVADEINADVFELVPVDPYSDADLNWRGRATGLKANISRKNRMKARSENGCVAQARNNRLRGRE